MKTLLVCVNVLSLVGASAMSLSAQQPEPNKLAEALAGLDARVFAEQERDAARQMLQTRFSKELKLVNQANTQAWKEIKSRDDWEAFRDPRIANLYASFGWLQRRAKPTVHVTGEHAGDGYRVLNLLYETRPRFYVSANLYLPAKPPEFMPGILISHSHHSPKTQGEVQDMGMTWARAGCMVLAPDHLGHGERRQHPFGSASDYEKEFAVGRQDYHFRYDLGMQLHLAGESLLGWLVWDLLAGVDVLMQQPRIDVTKIILLGGVAGGGDPAAVTAALDDRIACVVPFNFGGPQPETKYPLPEDAEATFAYAGSGSWESTRNPTDSAHGYGFQPWAIIGMVAPRKLIYAHEFSWDRQRDPVFKRCEAIWGFYDAADSLGFAHGKGTLREPEPEASHCNTIGAFHRRMIHPLLAKWFEIPASAESEYSKRRDPADLMCWNDEWRAKLKPRFARELLYEKVIARRDRERERFEEVKDDPLRFARLQGEWWGSLRLLLQAEPEAKTISEQTVAGITVSKLLLGERIALVILTPAEGPLLKSKATVLGVAREGKEVFLSERAGEIAKLLEQGIAVALVDVPGLGECGPGSDTGQNSAATSVSSTALMLGRSVLGEQVCDLQHALVYLSTHSKHRAYIGLWGESLVEPLPEGSEFAYPRRVDRPRESAPQAALAVLLLASQSYDGGAVYTRGGIVDYASLYETPFVQFPHDAVTPGGAWMGDLDLVVAALEPRPVRLEMLVDGCNRLASEKRIAEAYRLATSIKKPSHLQTSQQPTSPATFFIEAVRERTMAQAK